MELDKHSGEKTSVPNCALKTQFMREKQRGIEVHVKTYATCHQGTTKTVGSIARTAQVGNNIAESCRSRCFNCTKPGSGNVGNPSVWTDGRREDADGHRALGQTCCH